MRLTEDHVRLLRQLLLAREERRSSDARAIAAYLLDDGVRFELVRRRDCARAWLAEWKVPASAEELVVLVANGREPVFRIPVDHRRRAVSGWEVPSEIPPSLATAIRLPGDIPAIETASLRASVLALFGR